MQKKIITSKKNITERDKDVLKYIYSFICKHGFSPSVREIGRGTGLKSTSSVYLHLVHLEECGYILRKPDCPRTITILGEVMN